MPIFKLKKDELIQQWYRDYYEIEAETKEEALEILLDGDADPYDSMPLVNGIPDPLEMEVLDEEGNVIYSDKDDDNR